MSSKPNSRLGFSFLLILLFACAPQNPTPSPTAHTDSALCGDLPLPAEITCIDAPPTGLLLQSPPTQQASLSFAGVNITVSGTLYVQMNPRHWLDIAVLEGGGVVGRRGATRILVPGAQVRIELSDPLSAEPPTLPYPYDRETLRRAPLQALPRAISLPNPIAPPPDFTPPPTVTPTLTPSPAPTRTPGASPATHETAVPTSPAAQPGAASAPEEMGCAVREDWVSLYTIQRGDTLSRIAQRFDLALSELQEGNCIVNPDQIQAGQILYLPLDAFLATPTVIPTTAVTVDFTADDATVEAGQCTVLRWEVSSAIAVYFNNEETSLANTRRVCPAEDETYSLIVIFADGRQEVHTLAITTVKATSTSVQSP